MMAMSEDRDEAGGVGMKTIALSAAMGVLILLSLSVLGGVGVAMLQGNVDGAEAAPVLAVGAVIAGVAAWTLVRLKPWAGSGEPISANTRKSRNLLLLSGVIGGVLGMVLSFATISMDNPFALFSNSPMAPAVVIPALVVFLVVVPLISWKWHRSVDEHETEAHNFGGLAGLYLYVFLAPSWWLAWRGGLVPAPDTMIVYVLVMAVWGVGWFWRRYR